VCSTSTACPAPQNVALAQPVHCRCCSSRTTPSSMPSRISLRTPTSQRWEDGWAHSAANIIIPIIPTLSSLPPSHAKGAIMPTGGQLAMLLACNKRVQYPPHRHANPPLWCTRHHCTGHGAHTVSPLRSAWSTHTPLVVCRARQPPLWCTGHHCTGHGAHTVSPLRSAWSTHTHPLWCVEHANPPCGAQGIIVQGMGHTRYHHCAAHGTHTHTPCGM